METTREIFHKYPEGGLSFCSVKQIGLVESPDLLIALKLLLYKCDCKLCYRTIDSVSTQADFCGV